MNAETSLAVTLPCGSWDAIVSILARHPHVEVAALIDAIRLQARSQIVELDLIEAIWAAPLPMH